MGEEKPGAGARLADAQTTDREWRESLALRMHGRLGKLRRFDRAIQYGGIGISAVLLISVFVMAFRSSSAGLNVSLFIGLIVAAVGTSFGALGIVGVLTWLQRRTQNWIDRLGLSERLEPLPSPKPPAARNVPRPWVCSGCWSDNPGSEIACTQCGRDQPEGEDQSQVRRQKAAIEVLAYLKVAFRLKVLPAIIAFVVLKAIFYFMDR